MGSIARRASGRSRLDQGFLPGPRLYRPATGRGVLDGVRFAAKDVFDVAGVVSGFGVPDWARTHAPALRDAAPIARLRAAGASLVGLTISDELTFSLEGANPHFGTPVNPRAPTRLPGGSSSGSAVSVASGAVPAALGTDTGGSVRIPASFCGLFGFRPTHGRLRSTGTRALAPSYDTVGWFTRSGSLLGRFGAPLLGAGPRPPPRRLLRAADAWALLEPRCRAPLERAARAIGAAEETHVFDSEPIEWYETYRRIQGAELCSTLGPWLLRADPALGPRTRERVEGALRITPAAARSARARRRAIARRLARMLPSGTALVVPAAPSIALSRRRSKAQRADFYRRALALSSIAGHAGLPELVVPASVVEGAPIGLGVIGAKGSDESLFALAGRLDRHRT